MGYVYTPEEFESGKIATKEKFRRAVELSGKQILKLHERGLIYGANIHGSAIHADGGPGSDIDILIVFDDGQERAETELRTINRDSRRFFHVPLELIPLKKKWAEKGYHDISLNYANYIKNHCSAGVIGKDPLSVIASNQNWHDPRKDLMIQITEKVKRLVKGRTSCSHKFDNEMCNFLERVIRQPIYVAIDALNLKTGQYPSQNGEVLSKAECCRLYREEFPNIASEELFDVLEMRNAYKQFLIEGNKSPLVYKKLLTEIWHLYPKAKKFMERNLEYLDDMTNP